MLRGRCATVFLLSLFIVCGAFSVSSAATAAAPTTGSTGSGSTGSISVPDSATKGSDAADLSCPAADAKHVYYPNQKPYPAMVRLVSTNASDNVQVQNLYGKPCRDVRNDTEVVEGKCVAERKCQATECFGEACKLPDPARTPTSELNKNPSLDKTVSSPNGTFGGGYVNNGSQSVLSNVFSGGDYYGPSLSDVYSANSLFNPDFQAPQSFSPSLYDNLPQAGITNDFAPSGNNFGNTGNISSPSAVTPGEVAHPGAGVAPVSPTGITGFTSPQGIAPSVAPISTALNQLTSVQDPWSSAPITSLPESTLTDTGNISPATAAIDQAFGTQPKFEGVDSDWTKTAPVEYPYLSGAKIASQGVGTGFTEEVGPSSGEGPIRTVADVVRAPSPVNFSAGGTLESTVPAFALNGGWATGQNGIGSVWYGDVTALNGNGTNIAREYDYSAQFGGYLYFGPTNEQRLAQANSFEGGIDGGGGVEVPDRPVQSVDAGTAPAVPETFPQNVGAPENSNGQKGAGAEQTFDVTGYFPCKSAAACPTQGGPQSSQPGLDGQRVVRTLDDYRTGKSEYVTGASDSSRYGQTYEIPEVTYKSPLDGKEYTLKDVPVYVHDTGSAFAGRPDKLDVAVGSVSSESQARQWGTQQPFLADRYQTYASLDAGVRSDAGGSGSISAPSLPQNRVPDILAGADSRLNVPDSAIGVAANLPIVANVPLPIAAPFPKTGVDSGYTGGSVTDYFKSIGQDDSYAFRKQVAISYGISGFKGTAAQNSQLLRLLRGY